MFVQLFGAVLTVCNAAVAFCVIQHASSTPLSYCNLLSLQNREQELQVFIVELSISCVMNTIK